MRFQIPRKFDKLCTDIEHVYVYYILFFWQNVQHNMWFSSNDSFTDRHVTRTLCWNVTSRLFCFCLSPSSIWNGPEKAAVSLDHVSILSLHMSQLQLHFWMQWCWYWFFIQLYEYCNDTIYFIYTLEDGSQKFFSVLPWWMSAWYTVLTREVI